MQSFTYKNNAPGGGLTSIGGRHYRCDECGETVTGECLCCEVGHRCAGPNLNYCPKQMVSHEHVYAPLDDFCVHCQIRMPARPKNCFGTVIRSGV